MCIRDSDVDTEGVIGESKASDGVIGGEDSVNTSKEEEDVEIGDGEGEVDRGASAAVGDDVTCEDPVDEGELGGWCQIEDSTKGGHSSPQSEPAEEDEVRELEDVVEQQVEKEEKKNGVEETVTTVNTVENCTSSGVPAPQPTSSEHQPTTSNHQQSVEAVSYTHLTLPTIYSV